MACLMATERLDYYAASIVAIVAFGGSHCCFHQSLRTSGSKRVWVLAW